MASSEDNFGTSRPFNLTRIDWTNAYHKRSIAASLVTGAYILEHDRQQNRQGPQALAPPWWESFGFKLKKPLVDKRDGSYFGAIYEYEHWPSVYNYSSHPPRYVISFRGAIGKWGSTVQDFKLTFNVLHQSMRLEYASGIALNIVINNGPDNVWLAGHALGSTMGLMVGWNMIKMGFELETYLFNPPFPSTAIEHIENEKRKNVLRKFMTGHRPMPSANLTIHWTSNEDRNQAHRIDQWWRPDINDNYKLYQFATPPSTNRTIHLTGNEHLNQDPGYNQW